MVVPPRKMSLALRLRHVTLTLQRYLMRIVFCRRSAEVLPVDVVIVFLSPFSLRKALRCP